MARRSSSSPSRGRRGGELSYASLVNGARINSIALSSPTSLNGNPIVVNDKLNLRQQQQQHYSCCFLKQSSVPPQMMDGYCLAQTQNPIYKQQQWQKFPYNEDDFASWRRTPSPVRQHQQQQYSSCSTVVSHHNKGNNLGVYDGYHWDVTMKRRSKKK